MRIISYTGEFSLEQVGTPEKITALWEKALKDMSFKGKVGTVHVEIQPFLFEQEKAEVKLSAMVVEG